MISIIIPVHNELKHLNNCLISIKEKTRSKHEVIISDSNSYFPMNENYYTEAMKQGLIDNVVYDYHQAGFSRAINNGMKVVSEKTKYIVWLNSDTIIGSKGWLSLLSTPLTLYHDLVATGPISNSASYQTFVQCKEKDIDMVSDFLLSFKSNDPKTYLPNGFCVMIKKEAIERTGFIDEVNFPHYGSEDDYFLRMIGVKRICSNVFVFHHGKQSYKSKRKEMTKEAVKKLHLKYDSLEDCVTFSEISLSAEKDKVIKFILNQYSNENK